MDEAIRIKGLREVQKQLYSYSQQLGDKVIISALRRGANVVKKEIHSLAPVGKTRRLRRGFKVAKSRIHSGKHSTDMIGVYLKLKTGKRDPFYGRFINDGWNTHGKTNTSRPVFGRRGVYLSTRRSKVKGSSRVTQAGKTNVPGKHFVQRGFAAKRHAALRVIVETAQAGADLLARKVGR